MELEIFKYRKVNIDLDKNFSQLADFLNSRWVGTLATFRKLHLNLETSTKHLFQIFKNFIKKFKFNNGIQHSATGKNYRMLFSYRCESK